MIKHENEILKNRIEKIESKLITNNVILHGIEDQAWELKDITHEKVLTAISTLANGKTTKDKLDIVHKIGFKAIRRIGDYNSCRPRAILVEFEKKASADFLLDNKKGLPKGVYADQDYTPEEENKRRKLRPILHKAKTLPDYKMKSKLEGSKLIIKGKSYTSKNLHLLPEPLTGYNVSSKEDDTHIGFFGELNPFSNFHEAPFTVDSITYHSNEQFIQYKKARFFTDDSCSRKILKESTPLECKQLLKEIINYDPQDWREHAGHICEPGITAKFHQNPVLMSLLSATGPKTIVECAYHRLWGCGIPLQDPSCFDEDKWSGDNLLGKILMRLRAENSTIIGHNEQVQMET